MKRLTNFLLAASAVLALASCNKSATADIPAFGNGEIVFGTKGLRVETKAFSETTANTLENDGFKVAAIIDTDNSAMFNKAVAYANGVYSVPNEHYYWPLSDAMSFYAAYPATQAISVTNAGVATMAYTHNADTDLLVAKATAVTKTADAVEMAFGHALSQVSVKAQGEDTRCDYKLFSVTVTAPDGGTYAYANGSWTPSATTADNSIYNNPSGMAVSTEAMTPVGLMISVIPGTIRLNAVWKCYKPNTSILFSENDVTVEVTLPKGKHSTLNLSLPIGGDAITFTCSVEEWSEEEQAVEMVPPPPVFTVNDSGKKVTFSPGNLYWNGEEFKFEEHQYDYPTAWDANHVGHFFWSKTASIAYAASYSDSGKTTSDTFFAADGGVFEGFTVLSDAEWSYLITHSFEGGSSAKQVTINGKECVILKPDGFSGTVADTYTAAEWATAEASGLVALPIAGRRHETNLDEAGSYGYCWSSVPDSSESNKAWYAIFYPNKAKTLNNLRSGGYSIRLVKVAD